MMTNETATNEQRARSDGPVPAHLDPAATPELLAGDTALQALLVGVSSSAGEEFFRVMARSLAAALSVRYAIVAEFLPERASARSLALWDGQGFSENIEWSLAGTPCEGVVAGRFSHYPAALQQSFPTDLPLADLGAESYLGVPLRTPGGEVLGHLFVMDTRPMPAVPRDFAIFRIFATLAAKELARARLERSLSESEARLRDLFDEAPIAYVHEDLESRFIRANRAAVRILGIKPEDVPGTVGMSFIPDTPEAQRRVREAFESVGRGTDTSGVVLELRRKDNGKPIWIEWWSKPDPGGAYTRTMFLDITDRVLMEQERTRLQAQNRYLHEELRTANNFGEIIGRSPPLQRALESAERVAPTDSTVLIQGETGTGKELIARAIHERSARSGAPFVKVNCAALPAGLVESEFFGHERGAFTGAVNARKGRFELADGGTIFLDEVGEVTPEVQVKLLRVLQESEFERVGGTETIRVQVRVIAATNRDLAADVRAQQFRADLFYRLSVFPITVPPLRERATDIPVLAMYFVSQLASGLGKRIDRIEPETLDRLVRYSWPGNIRELRNLLERAVILADGPELRIEKSDLGAEGLGEAAGATTLAEMERVHILRVLEQTGGAVAGPKGAAKILGIPPSTLRSRMAKLGL